MCSRTLWLPSRSGQVERPVRAAWRWVRASGRMRIRQSASPGADSRAEPLASGERARGVARQRTKSIAALSDGQLPLIDWRLDDTVSSHSRLPY